jgi:hypothetical protein
VAGAGVGMEQQGQQFWMKYRVVVAEEVVVVLLK